MALEKNRRAIPFVEEGRALRAIALEAKSAKELLSIESIKPALLTASGLSDKALNHLEEEDKDRAIQGLVEEFLEPAGDDFVDELVYRFLLIRGDSLGGTMRNVAGFIAEQAFKRAIISALNLRKIKFYWHSKRFKKWALDGSPLDNTEDIVGISWNNGNDRTLVFNKTVKLIKKNIDICLLNSRRNNIQEDLGDPVKYLLLGGLKEESTLRVQMSTGKQPELPSREY